MLASRLVVLAGLVGLIASANAPAAPVFVLTGKGYGHGIGLSQYGTQGFAQHGWAHDEILEHYYRGAILAPGFPNDTVRVLLASGSIIARRRVRGCLPARAVRRSRPAPTPPHRRSAGSR